MYLLGIFSISIVYLYGVICSHLCIYTTRFRLVCNYFVFTEFRYALSVKKSFFLKRIKKPATSDFWTLEDFQKFFAFNGIAILVLPIFHFCYNRFFLPFLEVFWGSDIRVLVILIDKYRLESKSVF